VPDEERRNISESKTRDDHSKIESTITTPANYRTHCTSASPNRRIVSGSRFNPQSNVVYCRRLAASVDPPDLWAVLYTSSRGGPGSSSSSSSSIAADISSCCCNLWAVQKQLVEACLSSYLYPCRYARCVRVDGRSLDRLLHLMVNGWGMKPRLTRLVYLREYDAVLVLSAAAGLLLRYDELQFIASLALALDVDRRRLIAMVSK
jgi:hypothetical protein